MDRFHNILSSMSMFNEQALQFKNLILISLIIVGTIAIIVVINQHFKYLQKNIKEESEVSELVFQKLKTRKITLIISFLLISFILLHNNFDNFLTIMSLLSIGIIFAVHGQIQNILVGVLMKTEIIGTAIKEGNIIRIEGSTNNFKVLKIMLFKTYLVDLSSEEIVSYQNIDLILKRTSHEPVRDFESIEYILIVDPKKAEGISLLIEDYFKEILKIEEINFESLRYQIGEIKFKYNFFPKIKSRVKIKYRFIDQKNLEVKVLVKRVSYDYRKYNKEFEALVSIVNTLKINII